MVATMTAGDTQPVLKVTISDNRVDANFTPVTKDQCVLLVEQQGQLIIEGAPDSVVASPDGKSLTLSRAWQDDETAVAGYLWVAVKVNWGGTQPQTFPDEGAMRIDLARALGTG